MGKDEMREAIESILFRSGANNYSLSIDMLTAWAEQQAQERSAEELLWAATKAECRSDLIMIKQQATAARTATPAEEST